MTAEASCLGKLAFSLSAWISSSLFKIQSPFNRTEVLPWVKKIVSGSAREGAEIFFPSFIYRKSPMVNQGKL